MNANDLFQIKALLDRWDNAISQHESMADPGPHEKAWREGFIEGLESCRLNLKDLVERILNE